MRSFDDEGDDVFFNAYDNIRTSVDSTSSESTVAESQELVFGVWSRELMSVSERRDRFLRGTGLDEFVSSQSNSSRESEGATTRMAAERMGFERITENSGAVLDSQFSPDGDGSRGSECCIKDLDSGKRFIVQDMGQDGLFSMLREVGSDTLITLQEFEALVGLSCSVQCLMRRVVSPSRENQTESLEEQRKKHRSWWRSFMAKRHRMGICKSDVSIENPKLPRTTPMRVQQHCKRCLEYTALYVEQDIQAHKGSIRVMRFSPSGWYLASGGEDCIVRIWQVVVEASCKCFAMDDSSRLLEKSKDRLRLSGKCDTPTPIAIPEKVFKIGETPVQELRGHTSDILDLSWSNADCLLTSSKDKTVRMWKVGCNDCLKVFQHNDYVTCIQFNPADDRYFISGSIDGKVRVWGIPENRVVDWADIRDIVTALCYRPDGKGFVVGSITGSCRFYDFSDNTIQLGTQFCIQGKKKSAGKRITGLQFSPEDSGRVLVTSADSKVRIFDGVDVIHKFRGRRKTKSHLSASFTSDGRYIVSVGKDSHVYIWKYNTSPSSSSKRVKSVRPSEHFFSQGLSVVVPWPGTDIGAGLNNLRLPSPLKILDPSTWLKDSERYCLGALLLVDGLSRVSATWPEEKLPRLPPPSPRIINHAHRCHEDHSSRYLTSLASPWSLVILTGSSDGSIRSFHNYGLPVRL